MRVGVLGLGNMGQALAGRLLEQGHQVVVWNRSPGKATELVRQGATEADRPEAAARASEVVLTSLASDDAVRSTALGPGGLVGGLAEEALYADCSTSSPELAAALGHQLGARFVALPILGPPDGVRAGRATYLAGGEPRSVERLRPVLDSLTSKVRSYPAPELAQTAKLTSNLLLLAGVVALAEAVSVGRSGELTDDQLRELLGESPTVAPGVVNRLEGILSGDQRPWWGAALGAKDARLAIEVAAGAGVELPETETVRRRFEQLADQEGAEVDIAGVVHLYRRSR